MSRPVTLTPELSMTQREEALLLGGWPAELVPTAAATSEVELPASDPYWTVNSAGASGLMQMLGHPELAARYDYLDPVQNSAAAYELYREQGWAGAWWDWEPAGAHDAFLPAAEAALPRAEKAVAGSGGRYVLTRHGPPRTAPRGGGVGGTVHGGGGAGIHIPGTGINIGIPNPLSRVGSTLKSYAIIVPVVLGGTALVVLGFWRASHAGQKIREINDRGTQAAETAAVAA